MYITPQALINAFSEQVLIKLSNDDYRATEVDIAVLADAITTAQERIDVALRSRYRLPLADVPTLVRSHCLTLARYQLYARRPEMQMPATVKETYQQAIKELDQIASGRLHLGIVTDDEQTEASPESTSDDSLPDAGEYVVKSNGRLNTEGY